MRIVVHDGRAHADDFLAACVCHYKIGAPVVRSSFNEDMLSNPDFWVLDQGRRFEPELHNFDHHQLKEKICAFTMVLDHFYGKQYREYLPHLQFLEIYDSYGPAKAAEFAGTTHESLEITKSPIHSALLKSFSREDGLVSGAMVEIMWGVGREVCGEIENFQILLDVLTSQYAIFEINGIKVLDTTRCEPPKGFTHDQLPTKTWCKIKGVDPVVILTKDTRQEGAFRMVSINTDSVTFLPNPKSHFTHASGFLTSFASYNDHEEILMNHSVRNKNGV